MPAIFRNTPTTRHSINGYSWFLSLNIIFSLWFMMRNLKLAESQSVISHINTLFTTIFICSALILGCVLWLRSRLFDAPYRHYLPLAVLLLSLLWSVTFFNVIIVYNAPAITLVVAICILLPATIAFFTSSQLLLIFDIPIVLALFIGMYFSPENTTPLELAATVIVLAVIYSARYILVEWYLRVQRSEYEKNVLIKKLTRLAHYDPLTGLNNRRSLTDYFNDGVSTWPSHPQPFYLFLMDIDYFKQYNDTYGHVAGDECLINVARGIDQVLRRGSDIAFRYGGEEFVVISACDNSRQATQIAGRIRQKLADLAIPHSGSAVAAHVTISIGIARWQPGLSLENWLGNADSQLYRAKQRGRNQVCSE